MINNGNELIRDRSDDSLIIEKKTEDNSNPLLTLI